LSWTLSRVSRVPNRPYWGTDTAVYGRGPWIVVTGASMDRIPTFAAATLLTRVNDSYNRMTPNAAGQPPQGVITRNPVLSLTKGGCNESLHFVGLAISACLLTSWPSPSCTADSSAALRATAPVHCSAFLSTCLAMFCTSATFTATALSSPFPPCHFLCTSHILSLPAPSPTPPPQIPICFPECVVPISAHLQICTV
jgi:hypothetical protein